MREKLLGATALIVGLGMCPAEAHAALTIVEAAPGLYVHRGAHEQASSTNLGDIANIGFIIGARCVAVIDTGGSIAVGRELRRALRARTPLPVCYVINTHVHPDHVFGNAAFQEDGAVFVGHANLPRALAARGATYADGLKREVGLAAEGSHLLAPSLLVRDTLDLDLGGRNLRIKAWRTAHTDNDLTVYDEQTDTLWLSDLLFVDRVPVVDGRIKGWLEVIHELKAMRARTVIPGHGWVQGHWRVALEREERYLERLVAETRSAIKRGQTIQQTIRIVGQAERAKWLLFDAYHRRNATAVYAELEWEEDEK